MLWLSEEPLGPYWGGMGVKVYVMPRGLGIEGHKVWVLPHGSGGLVDIKSKGTWAPRASEDGFGALEGRG
jgi:hypothetical protein